MAPESISPILRITSLVGPLPGGHRGPWNRFLLFDAIGVNERKFERGWTIGSSRIIHL